MQTQSTRTVWLSHHISFFFFFNDTATTEIYTLSLHDALPIYLAVGCLSRTPYARYPEYHTSADNLDFVRPDALADSYEADRKSTRLNSSHSQISYAVFCLKKKKNNKDNKHLIRTRKSYMAK